MACRLCLCVFSESKETQMVSENSWMELLSAVLPQVNLDVSLEPTICNNCDASLKRFRTFRDVCFNTEDRISHCKRDENCTNTAGFVKVENISFLGHQKIIDCNSSANLCRICLNAEIKDLFNLDQSSTHFILIRNLFPELDFDLTKNPQICKTCSETTEELYQFQQMCLHVQTTLQDNCLKNAALSNEEFVAIAKKTNPLSNYPTDLSTLVNIIKSEPHHSGEEEDKYEGLVYKNEVMNIIKNDEQKFLSSSMIEKSSVDNTDAKNDCSEVEIKNEIYLKELHEPLDINKNDEFYNEDFFNNMKVKDEEGGSLYHCYFCDYKVKHERYIRYHVNNKHGKSDIVFQCSDCTYQTQWLHLFKYHMDIEHHKQGDYFKCPHCNYQTSRHDVLKRHLKVKHTEGDKSYKCQFCGHETKLKTSLLMHIKVKHDDNVELFKCHHCDYKTKRSGDLKMHIRCKHDEDSKVYFCQHCDYQTKRPSDLNVHVKAKHQINGEIHKCTSCDYETKWKTTLRKHIQVNHEEHTELLYCYHCSYSTSIRSHLRIHLRAMHNRFSESVKCPECPYETRIKHYLQNHIRLKHSPKDKMPKQRRKHKPYPKKSEAKPSQLHRCQYPGCQYETVRKSDLKTHIAVRHEKSVSFPCPFCDYRAKWKHSLHVHYRFKHAADAEMFECKDCKFTSKSRSDYNRHCKNVHGDGEDIYKCDYCEYQATCKTNLRRHFTRIHSKQLQDVVLGSNQEEKKFHNDIDAAVAIIQ